MAAHLQEQHKEQQKAIGKGTWVANGWRPASIQPQQQQLWSNKVAARAAAAAEDDSWEVRAFAEDAASCSGQWPPRSYSCSFCAREFRTAQALGGHMNVHRRERAYANQLGLMKSSSAASSHLAVSAANAAAAAEASAAAAAAAANTAPAPPPALGFCWVYPYHPASATSPLSRPPIHMHEGNIVYPQQMPTAAIFSPHVLPAAIGSPSITPELSLSPPFPAAPAAAAAAATAAAPASPNPSSPGNNSSSLSSSLSHGSPSLNSSGSDSSTTGSLHRKLLGAFQPYVSNASVTVLDDKATSLCPDLSGMRLIVVDENALDLELRLGHYST